MSVWNNVYKQNPPDDNNPGYGAAAIRDLKTNIEGLVGREHDFDFALPANQGKHLAGSAIIDLDSDTDAVNNAQIGRLSGITDSEDSTVATLAVNGETAYQNIKGYNQVSLAGDETIAGIKTFSTAPVISETVDDESSDTTIANAGYVRLKSLTSSIEPAITNVSPAVSLPITDVYGETITTMAHNATDTGSLEELLVQVNAELINLRTALNTVASYKQYGQDLNDTASPTFAGLTTTGTITGAAVYGVVWG